MLLATTAFMTLLWLQQQSRGPCVQLKPACMELQSWSGLAKAFLSDIGQSHEDAADGLMHEWSSVVSQILPSLACAACSCTSSELH